MILENTRFGALEIEDDKIIRMTRILPGFPGQQRFVILNRKESRPFLWYQSLDDPALAFVIINPFYFKKDYSVDIGQVISEMSWEDTDQEDLAVFVIVNASADNTPDKMTANLMAPLLVNMKRFEAFQLIIPDSPYSHKHPIFETETDGAS